MNTPLVKSPFVVHRYFWVVTEEVGNTLKVGGVVEISIRINTITAWFYHVVVGLFNSDTWVYKNDVWRWVWNFWWLRMFLVVLDSGDVADRMIGDTGSGILFMVPRTSELLCWMEMRVPGRKISWMGSILFQGKPQVRPPSKCRELGKLVIGSHDSSRRKAGGQ